MTDTQRIFAEIANEAVVGLRRQRDEEEKRHASTREQMTDLARAALTVVDEIDGPAQGASNESVDSLRHVLRRLGCLP